MNFHRASGRRTRQLGQSRWLGRPCHRPRSGCSWGRTELGLGQREGDLATSARDWTTHLDVVRETGKF